MKAANYKCIIGFIPKEGKRRISGPWGLIGMTVTKISVFAAHDSIIHFSPIDILTIVIVFCLFR